MAGKFSLKDLAERKRVAAAVIGPMLAAKKDRTVSSFYQRAECGGDGRLHTLLAPRTASGRLASSETGWPEETSTNLQNQPKKVSKLDVLYRVRDIFDTLCEDWVFVAGDYRNAEAILCAAYSLDWLFYEQMMDKHDVHRMHASLYFDVAEDQVTSYQRSTAKNVHYASLYMARPPTITRTLNKDLLPGEPRFEEAFVTDIWQQFLSLHPLEEWWRRVGLLLRKNGGWLRNPLGFKRTFYDPTYEGRLKDGLSFYPQSTVASLMNPVMIESYRTVDDDKTRLQILQVHDELLWLSRPDQVKRIVSKVTPLMERPFMIEGREVYVPVEWKVGNPWGGMEEYEV